MEMKPIFLSIVVACASLALTSSAALAEDGKSFPATMCQASGSAQDLHYGNGLISNRNATTQSAVCPSCATTSTAGRAGSRSKCATDMRPRTSCVSPAAWSFLEQ